MNEVKYDPEIWFAILLALKRARGRNQIRGRQTALPLQGKLVLELERRQNRAIHANLVIVVGNSTENTYFSHMNELIRLSDCNTIDAFVEQALNHCRHRRPYIHTYDSKTEYKPHYDGLFPKSLPHA